MIYTDGFVNEETYFSQGHIWHVGMKWRGKESLFVCICRVCPDKDSESVEKSRKIIERKHKLYDGLKASGVYEALSK